MSQCVDMDAPVATSSAVSSILSETKLKKDKPFYSAKEKLVVGGHVVEWYI